MNAFAKLISVEAKLLGRDIAGSFFTIAFPAVLLVALGSFFPGFLDRDPASGVRTVDIYLPIVLALGLASAALATMPTILATYRQLGVLRRMATTPVGPVRLLLAQLVVQVAASAIGAVAAVVAAAILFETPFPRNPLGFTIVFLLAAASIFAVGLIVAAVARTTSAGQGIGLALYFPTLFFSGVYFPREAMPDALRTISDLTPLGSGVQALKDTWLGLAPAAGNLVVMAAFALVSGIVAARLFRWE